MENAPYYRGQAERARRLAHSLTNREVEALLERVAQDYEDIAVDLESGADRGRQNSTRVRACRSPLACAISERHDDQRRAAAGADFSNAVVVQAFRPACGRTHGTIRRSTWR